MRRSLLGLLTVVAIAGMLVMAGCERSGTLRVMSINNGNTLRADLADYYEYLTPDSELIVLYQVPPDSVKVELQYVEIGAGLPTWTPYEALISQATVKFTSKGLTDEPPVYEDVKVTLAQSCVADANGKNTTTFYMTPISSAWKQKIFADYIVDDDPEYLDIVDIADAKITFSGYDSVAGRKVEAVGTFPVEFGNFYDDPSRFGR
jgi:hypothetical protein